MVGKRTLPPVRIPAGLVGSGPTPTVFQTSRCRSASRHWPVRDSNIWSIESDPMKILFLHGLNSTPGGIKPTFLQAHGHTVLNPALPDDDFDEAVRIAQAEFDQHCPDVVVGSSRGGAVAMNLQVNVPLVLLCPAWKHWGQATTVKPNTMILHSPTDEVVPFADSQELLRNSGLPESALIAVGHDHRLADEEPLGAMLETVERVFYSIED